MKLTALIGAGLAFARKHEGTILTVCSMASTVAAVYFALKDSDKIAAALDEIRENEEMTKIEKATTLMKPAARVVVATGASLGFQVANHRFASNTISSLTNAVTMYKTLNEEKDKAIERKDEAIENVVGKETAEEINRKAAESHAAEAYSMFDLERAEVTGHGNDLIYFEHFETFFYGSYNHVESCVNAANRKLNAGSPVTVNELFDDIGLKRKPCYDALGWKEYDDCIEISPVGDVDSSNKPYVTIVLGRSSKPHGIGARRW